MTTNENESAGKNKPRNIFDSPVALKGFQSIIEKFDLSSQSIVSTMEPILQEVARTHQAIAASIISDLSENISLSSPNLIKVPQLPTPEFNLPMMRLSEEVSRQQQEILSQINKIVSQNIWGFSNIITKLGSRGIPSSVFEGLRVYELGIFAQTIEFPALAQLSKSILELYSVPEVKLFTPGFLQELALVLESIPIDLEINEELIDELESRISDQVDGLPPGTINAQGTRETILALITILSFLISLASVYGDYLSGETLEAIQQEQHLTNENLDRLIELNEISNEETRQNREITQKNLEQLVLFAQTVLPHVETLATNSQNEEKVFYVVAKPSFLRIEPGGKGKMITKLYPNQLLELIDRRQDWVYIQYFDYNQGASQTGWVYRRNLRLLK